MGDQKCKFLIGSGESWYACKLKKGKRCTCQRYCPLKGTFTLTDCSKKCVAYKESSENSTKEEK